MRKFTIIAPRKLWKNISGCTASIPRSVEFCCREGKAGEELMYTRVFEGSDITIIAHQVRIHYGNNVTEEEIALIKSLLQPTYPNVLCVYTAPPLVGAY